MSEQDNQGDDTQANQNTQVEEESNLKDQLLFGDESSTTENVEEEVTPDETSEPEEKPEETEEKSDQKPEPTPKEEQETEAERNRRYYEQRQEAKRQRQVLEQQVSETYKPQPVDELTQHYIDQGYDEFQAQVLARDEVRTQKEQISEARAEVAELNLQINSEAMQVLHDFPEFDPGTPDKPNPLYEKDLAERARARYEQYAKPVIDPRTGLIVQTNLTPYDFFKEEHQTWNSGRAKAEVKAQRNVEEQLASATPPSSSAPIQVKSGNTLPELEKRLVNYKF